MDFQVDTLLKFQRWVRCHPRAQVSWSRLANGNAAVSFGWTERDVPHQLGTHAPSHQEALQTLLDSPLLWTEGYTPKDAQHWETLLKVLNETEGPNSLESALLLFVFDKAYAREDILHAERVIKRTKGWV